MSKVYDIGTNETALRACSARVLLEQIGTGNVMAISGLRVGRVIAWHDDEPFIVGVVLPVANGWAVHVVLAGDDTYTVRRMFRGKIKREWTGIYAGNVGQVAYNASLYENGGE